MYRFRSLRYAASFALRLRRPALVFDGPGCPSEDYVVAVGSEARELEVEGHEAYTLAETSRAARSEPVSEEG